MATATQRTTAGNKQANDALSVLLQELLNGGTQQMQQQQAQRQGEVNQVSAQRARYTPEAAFADAQGLMAQILRQAMEKNVSTITRAAEGAGTSANSMRALLTQDALTRGAEASASAGLQAAQGYGQIGANLSGILESLTRPDNSAMDAILATISAMQNADKTTTTSGADGTGGSSRSSGNRTVSDTADFFNRPGGILDNANKTRAQTMQYYGPAATDIQIADKIQKGLGPSQALADVAGINNLYSGGLRF